MEFTPTTGTPCISRLLGERMLDSVSVDVVVDVVVDLDGDGNGNVVVNL